MGKYQYILLFLCGLGVASDSIEVATVCILTRRICGRVINVMSLGCDSINYSTQ